MDEREKLLKDISNALTPILDEEIKDAVVNLITVKLGRFTISPACTDLVVSDGQNERMVKAYLSSLAFAGRQPSTIKAYKRQIELFLDAVGKPIKEIQTFDIRMYLANLEIRGNCANTVKGKRSDLRAFFAWLSATEMISRNPMATLEQIKVPKKEKKAFTRPDLEKLKLACTCERDRAIIDLFLTSGCRVSEVVGMNRSDVDLHDRTIHVTGKGNKQRVDYISDTTVMHLEAYLAERTDDSPALFIGRRGNRMTDGGMRNMMTRLSKRAGVPNVHPHKFRRTFATTAIDRGMPIETLADLMGHSSLQTTKIYIESNQSRNKNAYDRLGL